MTKYRHRPLRIEHDPDEEYTVVYIDGHEDWSDSYQHNGNDISSPVDLFAPLGRLVTTTMYHFDRLKLAPNAVRATFLQLVANARYYHELLVKEIEGLDEFSFRVQFGERDRALIMTQLRELEEQVPDWDYRNVYYNMFYRVQTKWDYATSKLFIVLPSDLKSWDDADSSTHLFRLYFLCDNRMDVVARSGLQQHVHLSNHPGYNLLQPQEFFCKYGDYVLRLLELVKHGYSDNAYDIPSDTSAILWKFSHTSSTLNRRTITSLVEKAIAHIQALSPPKWIMEPGLTRNQSAAIKDFLEVQGPDNTEGNLHRYIDSGQHVSWRCQMHKEQHFGWRHLKNLRTYIDGRRGRVDMQQGILQVQLKSFSETDQFHQHLSDIRHLFNLSIKLNWNTTRSEMEKLCQSVAQRKTVALEIDGVPLKIFPSGYVHYTRNIFAEKIVPDTVTGLQLVTVLNYPAPKEQCIHIGKFVLQSKSSLSGSSHSWVDLRADLDRVGKLVSGAQDVSECKAAVTQLQLVRKKHGLADTTSVTIQDDKWGAVFDSKDGAIVEAYSLDASCPMAIYSSGSLRRLTVDLRDLEFDKEFFQIVHVNTGLKELNVSYHGHDVFYYFNNIVKYWHESESSYCLTLLDRLQDTTQGRVVARMLIQRRDSDGSGDSKHEVDQNNSASPAPVNKVADPPANINFIDWVCDQVSAKLFGHSATLLDMATEQHSAALKLLTLDTSQLKKDGLASVQNILRRSRLEHLNVACNSVDPTLKQSISDMLEAVQWDTLKSLVLVGDNPNEWMDLWPAIEAPQLLSLQIRGTGLVSQDLTHSSILFIHQLASESSMETMDFKGVRLQDPRDWTVIVDVMDPAHLKKLGLCESSMDQFLTNSDAVDLFDYKFKGGIGAMAYSHVSIPQVLEDALAQRTRERPSRTQDTEAEAPFILPEMGGYKPDILPKMGDHEPLILPEMGGYEPDILPKMGNHESLILPEMGDHEPFILPEMGGYEPLILPKMGDHEPLILPEMGCGTETWTPAILPETGGDIETRSPSATSELSDDTGIETPVSRSDGTGTQTPVSAPDMSDDTETQTWYPIPHGSQDVTAKKPPPGRPHGGQHTAVEGPSERPQRVPQDMAAERLPTKPQGAQDVVEQTPNAAPNVACDIAMLKPITAPKGKHKAESEKPK
ncbi:hypothetical protein CPB97_007571, partial [Podila verticillata]